MRTLFLALAICFSNFSQAQSTIGLTQYDSGNTDGYVLFSGVSSKQTYLVDKCGLQIKAWNSDYKPGLSVELLPNGDLFRTGLSSSTSFGSGGGKGGILEKFDWNGNLLWSYEISDSDQCQHHDAIVLANGNILAIVWDRVTLSQATQAGKNPAITSVLNNQEVWSEKIVELQPTGTNTATIVWEWKAWEHLIQDFDNAKSNYGVVNEHPELINVNYVLQGPPTNSDWLHINSVDYNPITDEIILSNHNFGEFWIIDHSTTTAEAAGHAGGTSGKGGDLLYRWGNPMTYGRGVASDQKLFKQHHATFIKPGFPNAGKILVFNNGVDRPGGSYSSIDMIDIAQAGYPYSIGTNSPYLPASTFWDYTAVTPTSFYAPNISGVYPLLNGSFLITDGPNGNVFEIDSTSTVKWQYINPVDNSGPMTQGTIPALNTVFRANFYPPDYSAFTGIALTPSTEIELNPTVPSICSSVTTIDETMPRTLSIYPNPIQSDAALTIEHDFQGDFQINMFDMSGKLVFYKEILNANNISTIDLPSLKKGVYFLKISSENGASQSDRIIVI
jgi:hypothetical protein